MWQECLPSLCFFAKASMEAVGSEPIDKKKDRNENHPLKSKILVQQYFVKMEECVNFDFYYFGIPNQKFFSLNKYMSLMS